MHEQRPPFIREMLVSNEKKYKELRGEKAN